ncbi:hypothetical protein BH11MYX1_BH11MYX1_12760 [soil metagenome]
MKIVCDACQAKYSISDDKVQGKVFKIRCKKCSNIIVVRGGASEQPQAAVAQEKDTRVYDYGYEGGAGDQAPAADDAVWHLVINQDQVGPMTVAEVQQRFAAGEIDGETFTWREGFGDWLPLSQVEPFSALVTSGSSTSAGGGGGAAAIGAMFGSGDDAGGTSRSDPGDLFASASAGSSSRVDEDDGGGDLFGAKPGTGAGASASAAANSKLRGERNENSVLFSLNNLAQLASDKPAISAPSGGGGGGGGHATGAAGGEGSGLIDIRSMASAYMGGANAGAMGKPQTASAIGSIDDLPVFGGGGFSEPAVLVPTVRASANNKMMYMMIAAVSLLAIVAIIMVVIMMKGSKDKPATTGSNAVAVADPGSAATKPEVAGSDTTTGSAAKPTVAVVEATGSASGSDVMAKPETPAKTDPTPVKTTTAVAKKDPAPKTTTTHTQVATGKPDKKPDSTPTATPTTKAETGGCDEVSCVLNNYEGACCSKFRKGGAPKTGGGAAKPAAGGGGDLPDGLDRGMISAGIANVKARVSACGDKSPAKGKVKVHVKVGGDGRVANVALESSPDAGLGACVVAAVQKASFSKTQSGGSFSYPFVF